MPGVDPAESMVVGGESDFSPYESLDGCGCGVLSRYASSVTARW